MGVFRSQERGVWWKLKVISQWGSLVHQPDKVVRVLDPGHHTRPWRTAPRSDWPAPGSAWRSQTSVAACAQPALCWAKPETTWARSLARPSSGDRRCQHHQEVSLRMAVLKSDTPLQQLQTTELPRRLELRLWGRSDIWPRRWPIVITFLCMEVLLWNSLKEDPPTFKHFVCNLHEFVHVLSIVTTFKSTHYKLNQRNDVKAHLTVGVSIQNWSCPSS